MAATDMSEEPQARDASELPFVAPCRDLAPSAPLGWLRLGARDFRDALPQSLCYGCFMALVIALVCWLAWRYGSYWFMLAMLGGFVFLAPLTCIGLYALSAQLERREPPSLRVALRETLTRHLGNEMIFALALLIVFLVWARAAAMISVFMPARGHPGLADLGPYLLVGTGVGAIFAFLTFSVSAFSLPMIMHRRVDAITAVVTSINAVLRNPLTMLVWLGLIVLALIIGFATAFLGLVVVLPVIGHAVWHGYLETVDASEFPRHSAGVTALPRPLA